MGSNIYLHSVGLHRVAKTTCKIWCLIIWLYYILLPRSYLTILLAITTKQTSRFHTQHLISAHQKHTGSGKEMACSGSASRL